MDLAASGTGVSLLQPGLWARPQKKPFLKIRQVAGSNDPGCTKHQASMHQVFSRPLFAPAAPGEYCPSFVHWAGEDGSVCTQ